MDTTKTVIGTDWEEVTITGDMRLQNKTGGAEVEVFVKDLQVLPAASDEGVALERLDIADFTGETRFLYVRSNKKNTAIITW